MMKSLRFILSSMRIEIPGCHFEFQIGCLFSHCRWSFNFVSSSHGSNDNLKASSSYIQNKTHHKKKCQYLYKVLRHIHTAVTISMFIETDVWFIVVVQGAWEVACPLWDRCDLGIPSRSNNPENKCFLICLNRAGRERREYLVVCTIKDIH